MGLRNIFIYPVEAINEISTNVWSVVLIGIGAILVLHGQAGVGGSLLTGGFAILRSGEGKKPEVQPDPTPVQVPDPNAQK